MEPNNRPLPCRWRNCVKIFPDAEQLLIHCTDKHIGRKSNNNLCLDCQWEGCDVKTTKRDHITSHLKVHIAFKPYSCQTCSKSFKRPQDLKKHQKLHKDAEEYERKYLDSNEVRNDNDLSMLSAYGSSYANGSNVPVSPFSGSSDNMVNTPPNLNNLDPSMDFYNNALNKQLPNKYNADVAQLLNNIQVDQNGYPIIPNNFANNMDLNYFNSMMYQLQGSFGINSDPAMQNFMADPNNPTQPIYANDFMNQNQHMYMNNTTNNNFINYENQQQFVGMNQFNSFNNQNFDPNFNYNQSYPSLDFDNLNQGLQYDANGLPLQMPTFDAYNQHFNSVHVTQLRKSFVDSEIESKDDITDDIDSLAEGLGKMHIKPTSKETDLDETKPVKVVIDKEKLKHYNLIKLLVSKMNDKPKQQDIKTDTKTVTEKNKDVKTSTVTKVNDIKSCKIEALNGSTTDIRGEDLRTVDYPSLDDF